MKYTVHIGNQPITLEHDNFDRVINVDDLTKIDPSNLFGEAVTITPAANRIGLLKAEVESAVSEAKLELRIFEAKFKGQRRYEAAQPENKGCFIMRFGNEEVKIKATEKALETCFEDDPDWIKLKHSLIKSENNAAKLASLFWATQDKARKLNNLVAGVTPSDFVDQLVSGTINGILVKK